MDWDSLLTRLWRFLHVQKQPSAPHDELDNSSSAGTLEGSEEESTTPTRVSASHIEESIQYIQEAASHFPLLNEAVVPDWALVEGFQPEDGSIPDKQFQQNSLPTACTKTDKEPTQQEIFLTNAAKPKLTLATPRTAKAISNRETKVRIITKPSRTGPRAAVADLPPDEPETATQLLSLVSSTKMLSAENQQSPTVDRKELYNDTYEESFKSYDTYQQYEPEITELTDEVEEELNYEDEFTNLSVFESFEEYEHQTQQEDTHFDLEIEDDYAAYAFDPDAIFDSNDYTIEEPSSRLEGRLSRDDRALQKAAELIDKAGWPHSALPLVQQIFVVSGCGVLSHP